VRGWAAGRSRARGRDPRPVSHRAAARTLAVCLVAAAAVAAALAAARPPAAPDSVRHGSTRVRDLPRPRVRRVTVQPSALESRPIGRVEIQPGNVYEPGSGRGISALHRLANRLHTRTRPATVRNELLFAPGGSWSERTALETARNLRALDYLVPQRIEARPLGDSVAVTVETRDLWTTSPDINIESVGGTRSGASGFTERNLLGLGKSIAVLYRQGSTGVSRSLTYDDPNLGGGHVRLRAALGKSSDGASRGLSVGRPFYAEETPRSWSVSGDAVTSVARLYQNGSEVADFDQRLQALSLAHGWRLPFDSTITRLTLSFEMLDRRWGASRLAPGAPPEFAGGEEEDRRRMLAAEVRFWNPRFVEAQDVDRMDRVEDFDLGTSLRLKAGFAPRFLGSTGGEAYGRARIDVGALGRPGFGWVRASVESRLRPAPRDLISQLDGRWYFVSGGHTVALAAAGRAGGHASRSFQILAGGLNGLRAFPAQAVAGRRLWRFNAEDRWLLTPERWQLLRVATAVFYDAARAWGPGAEGSGWFHDAGVGLRLGFPRGGLAQVVRVDVTWPIEPTIGRRREPVFSFGSSQAF